MMRGAASLYDLASINNVMALPESRVLLTLLEETNEGATAWDELKRHLRISSDVLEILVKNLSSEGLINLSGDLIEVSCFQRLNLAIRAVELGVDIERVSRALGWREFEEMAAYIFEENGFEVQRRLRFKAEGRRWEIDLVAIRRPYILCAECKRWRRGMRGLALERVVERQLRRVRALVTAGVARVLKIGGWKALHLLPLVLLLSPPLRRLLEGVPIIPILELPSFLGAFEGHLKELWHLEVEVPPERSNPHQAFLRPGV